MTDWQVNVTKLKEIKQNDSIFWRKLVTLAKTIQNTNYKYIDDHTEYHKELETVIIVQSYNKDGVLNTSTDMLSYGAIYPLAKIIPGDYKRYTYMKAGNALYKSQENKLRLTQCASGVYLSRENLNDLVVGKEVIMKCCWSNSFYRNFMLPVLIFVETVLEV